MSNQRDRELNKRAAQAWDDQTSKRRDPYRESESDGSVSMSDFLKLLALVGGFVIIASVLFGGTPDLVDAFRQYLECK